MNFAWKFMVPLSLIGIFAAGLWRFLPTGVVRWVVCSAILIVPYILLGRGLAGGKPFAKRRYQYAE
jgi:NADH-quinone oxidoreductase subunit H